MGLQGPKNNEKRRREYAEKMASMSPEEKDAYLEQKREAQRASKAKRKAKKEFNPKGMFVNEEDWMLKDTSAFVNRNGVMVLDLEPKLVPRAGD